MRVRATISDGNSKNVVFDYIVNAHTDFNAGLRMAIKEFERLYPEVALSEAKVSLDTISPGLAQIFR